MRQMDSFVVDVQRTKRKEKIIISISIGILFCGKNPPAKELKKYKSIEITDDRTNEMSVKNLKKWLNKPTLFMNDKT